MGGAIYNNEGTATVQFNRIIGNTAIYGGNAITNDPMGGIDVALNWWGSNTGPSSGDFSGTVTSSPWLVLTLSSNIIVDTISSPITADLLHDSNGILHDPNNGYVPDGIPGTFTTTLGTIVSSSSTYNGFASSILNTESATGLANITFKLDNQIVKTSVIVMNPPTVSANLTSGLYNSIQKVALAMSEPGTIYYTIDGTTPNFNSNRYTNPLSIANTTTLQFFAMDLTGNTSPTYTKIYTLDTTPPTARSNLIGVYYNISKLVTLSMSEPGKIYYTLNGVTPTIKSTNYKGPITISKTTILKFLAVDLAGNKSPVYSQTYKINKRPPKVTTTIPTNKKTNVSRISTIVIKFSENIKASTYYSNIKVKNLTTGRYVTINKAIRGTYLNIKTTTRSKNTWYTVTIPRAAIKDIAGNNLIATYTFKFKTSS